MRHTANTPIMDQSLACRLTKTRIDDVTGHQRRDTFTAVTIVILQNNDAFRLARTGRQRDVRIRLLANRSHRIKKYWQVTMSR